MIVEFVDFSIEGRKKQNKTKLRKQRKFVCFHTVKLSSNLFVGKLGLTLRICDGETWGTVPDDAIICFISCPRKRRRRKRKVST